MKARILPAVVLYLAIWGASAAWLARAGFGVVELVFALVLLGGVFSLAAWASTRKLQPLRQVIRDARIESLFLLAWVSVLAAYFVWGVPAVGQLAATERAASFVKAAAKLVLFVMLPAAWFMLRGYSLRELMPARVRDSWKPILVFAVLATAFQVVFGRGPALIREAQLSTAMLIGGSLLAFAWMAVEAGLVEEFFFRTLLQSRLAEVMRSQAWGIVAASLLFALMHAPGIYLRGHLTGEGLTNASLLTAAAYTVVITSLAGLFLGVLWARTRNLWTVVAVHALVDLVPNLVPTLRSFGLLER